MSNENQETKLCKYCKTEIPKKAKVCPNCRKKQGGKLKWIVITVVAILIMAAIAGGGDDNKPHQVDSENNSTLNKETVAENDTSYTEVSEQEESEKETFSVGETAEMNDVQVTMLNYEEIQGSEYNKPTDGNIFVLVEFEIVNNSDKELTVSSVLSFDAYADDYSLNYSLGALLEKEGENQLDGTIAAGKKMKGVIGYEVSKDWEEIEIHFTDNVWGSNKFKFLIQK